MEEKDNSLFKLRWDAQRSALLGSVAVLFREEAFIDTTIFTDGKIFKAHRLLLSASSPYLKQILQSVPGEHAALLLPHINSNDFGNVLKFIYEGEIKICQKDLKSFLQVSRLLKIKGMDFEDEDYNDDGVDQDSIYRKVEAASRALRDSPRPKPSTTTNPEARPNNNNDHYSASSHDEHDQDEYNNIAAATEAQRRSELGFQKTSHLDDYDEKDDGLHMAHDEGEEPDNTDMLDDSEDGHDDGFPLLPEVSMEVSGESFHMKGQMPSDLQIMSSPSQGSSWGIPHSSTSSNHSRGGHGVTKPYQKKPLARAPGEGILMRMMREPLKSSMTSPTPHSQSHPGYEIDETGLKRTKRYVQCGSCSKVLSSLSALKRHMEDVHCARIQGKCLICARVYSSRNSLLTHVYSAHKKHHDYKAVARIIRESDFETFAAS